MTEQDCQQVYQDLADLLQSLQLGWVVEQAKTSLHTIGVMGHDQPAVIVDGPASSSTQAVLAKSVTHTAQNQLIRLIDAAQRVVVDTTEMEGALVDFLAEVGQHLPTPLTLGFASEDS